MPHRLLFRPARPDDQAAMLALCAQFWDGRDYIPEVWHDWLADSHGQFTAVVDAEAGGRLIGLGKLTRLGEPRAGEPGEWWLEGLRVDPAYQGRGIGSQLHEYHLGLWRRGGPGVLRLVTNSENKPVRHLCERTGFHWIADVTVFEAEAARGQAGPSPAFRPLFPPEVDSAFPLVERAHPYRAFQRLFCFDSVWKWAALTPQRLAHRAAAGQAWLWREAQGVLVGDLAPEGDSPLDDRPCLFVCFAGAGPDSLPELLRDARSFAATLGQPLVGLAVPLNDPVALGALSQAGYGRAWEGSLSLYEAAQ